MDWESPFWLVLAAPALFFLLWVERGSVHPMDVGRRRLLLVFRGLMVLLTLVALAGPAATLDSSRCWVLVVPVDPVVRAMPGVVMAAPVGPVVVAAS